MAHTLAPEVDRPPTKSVAGLVAGTVAMGVALSGLLWWKLAEGSPAASAPPPPPPAPVVRSEPAPPPPPPPVSVEPPAAQSSSKPSTATAPSGCGGTCTGSAPAELAGALRARAGAARSCYERALRQNPSLQGRLSVGLRVSPLGRVCSASVIDNSLGDAQVASCVVALMRSASVPAPHGGCVDVQIPMTFVGKM